MPIKLDDPNFQQKMAEFLRSLTKPSRYEKPGRDLEGDEKEKMHTLLALMEPFETNAGTHCWTEIYRIGDKDYHLTSGPYQGFDITEYTITNQESKK